MQDLDLSKKVTFTVVETSQSDPTEKSSIRPIFFPLSHRAQAIKDFDQSVSSELVDGIQFVLNTENEKVREMIKHARALVENGEYSLAQNILRAVLLRNSKNPDAAALMGRCYLGLGNTSDAISCAKSAVSTAENFSSLSLLAEAYYQDGNDESALEFYLKALEQCDLEDMTLFEVYKNLGNIYVRLGQLNLASASYAKAYTIHSDSEILLVNYGTLSIQMNDWNQAIDFFRAAASINPEYDRAWLGLALVHRHYGDHELALGNLETALDINPLNRVAIQLYCDWALAEGDLSKAIPYIAFYLESECFDTEMSLLFGQILFDLRRFDASMLEVERVLTLDPTNRLACELNELLIRVKKGE